MGKLTVFYIHAPSSRSLLSLTFRLRRLTWYQGKSSERCKTETTACQQGSIRCFLLGPFLQHPCSSAEFFSAPQKVAQVQGVKMYTGEVCKLSWLRSLKPSRANTSCTNSKSVASRVSARDLFSYQSPCSQGSLEHGAYIDYL